MSLVLRIHDVGVGQHVIRSRDVVPDDRFGVGDDLVGQVADPASVPGLTSAQLCGTTSGLVKINRIGSPALTVKELTEKVRFFPASIRIGRDVEIDLAPRVRDGLGRHRQVGQDRVRRDHLRRGGR